MIEQCVGFVNTLSDAYESVCFTKIIPISILKKSCFIRFGDRSNPYHVVMHGESFLFKITPDYVFDCKITV